MRKGTIALCLLVYAAGTYAAVEWTVGNGDAGGANLHQIGKSGIKARIRIVDHGDPAAGLEVTGTATGLDPGQAYFSLFYDSGAKPSGPSACAPNVPGALTQPQMFISFWQVDGNGNGTLQVTKTGPSYAALGALGAMSIRLGATGALQACGKVTPADESARTCRLQR